MKKSILLITILSIGLFAFKSGSQTLDYRDVHSAGLIGLTDSFPPPKRYSVVLNEQEWNSRYTWVMVAKQMLEKSNLPINEVKPLNDSLSKFLTDLQNQLVPQMRPDTTNKATKPKK